MEMLDDLMHITAEIWIATNTIQIRFKYNLRMLSNKYCDWTYVISIQILQDHEDIYQTFAII